MSIVHLILESGESLVFFKSLSFNSFKKALIILFIFRFAKKVRELTGKVKTLKMDSEAILGPKWKPRGVLESGDHVESDSISQLDP